ncbi:MAG: hypothetical protein PUB18_04150, partial [bacterium]|nr:hypothetical protein [bacterium]
MTVFKAFLKVLKSCKIPIILYTLCLVLFSVFFVETNDSSTNFVASKPDVLIVNYDEEIGITKGLIDYIKQNSNIIELKNDENVIRDALFYRDINYIIYIPN